MATDIFDSHKEPDEYFLPLTQEPHHTGCLAVMDALAGQAAAYRDQSR